MEEKNKVNIFSDPEVIDTVINTKLASFPRHNGSGNSMKTKWTDEELELMDCVIMEYIVKQGLSREETAKQIFARWDVTLKTARRYVSESIKRFCERYTESNRDEQIRIWEQRITAILEKALEHNTKDSALKALDMYAKYLGVYVNKQDINLEGNTTVTFDFQ